MGLCYTLKLLATVLKWDLRGYWAKASWCQVSLSTYYLGMQLSETYKLPMYNCTCRSSRGDPTPFCLSTSHCYEGKSYIKWPAGRHEFSELFKRPIYHFEIFYVCSKEGRGKNRGNYNSGHRLHAKDFFGNNFAISQGDLKEGNLAEIFRQEGRNEGGLLSSIQLGGISFISHLKGWKRK